MKSLVVSIVSSGPFKYGKWNPIELYLVQEGDTDLPRIRVTDSLGAFLISAMRLSTGENLLAQRNPGEPLLVLAGESSTLEDLEDAVQELFSEMTLMSGEE